MLYYLVSKVYAWFGVGIKQARLLPLVFGLFLIFGLLWWQRYFSYSSMWVGVLLLSLSPIMGYFSTFLVHDFLCLFLIFFATSVVFKFLENKRAIEFTDFVILGAAFGTLNAAKLIGLIYLVLFLGYFCLYLVMSKSPLVIKSGKNLLINGLSLIHI